MRPTEGEAAVTAAPSRTPAARQRFYSLDVFRGLTVAGMLLVNTPGSWSAIYPPLRHAPWHGWTAADLIFPFFLFIVGVTTWLSITSARERGVADSAIVARILRRGLLIVLFGLLVSAFPYFPLERISEMRIPGVLQRIGVAYLFAALITLRGSWRTHLLATAGLLLGYWYVMVGVPVPGQPQGAPRLEPAGATMAAWVDRLLLDGHLWAATKTWDPEGVLSTIPAIASVLVGTLAARLIFSSQPLVDRVKWLGAAGAAGVAAGLSWGLVFPINKNIWTSSYVLFAAGMAGLVLALSMWVIEVKQARWWTRPFAIFGLNPLIAFVGSMLMARTIYSLTKVSYEGATVPVQTAVYKAAFASWLAPANASLLFAVCFLLLWLGILWLLERRNIVITV